MSKAILALDEMPESCEKCPLLRYDVVGHIGCAATSNIVLRKDGEKKPDWCPLRPLPEKMKTGGVYKGGWNDAIEAIEGSGKDDDEGRTD